MITYFSSINIFSLLVILALATFSIARKPWEPPPASENIAAPAQEAPQLSGEVLETMNSGGYTYLKISSGGSEIWVAANEFKIAVGQTAYVYGANEMENFTSKTLGRTFDKIIFANSISAEGEGDHAHASNPHGSNPHGNMPKQEAKLDFSKIKPLKGGTQVGDLLAKPKKWKGKKVSVRGLVVKANYDIMGAHWYHIQDGSGNAPDNDLVVTSTEKVNVGDVVVAQGPLSVDKDLGSGYFFKAILEKAQLKLEK